MGRRLKPQLSRNLQHALDGLHGLGGYRGVNGYFGRLVLQALVKFLQCIQAHVVAFVARMGTGRGWGRDEVGLRTTLTHFVQNTRFSSYNIGLFRMSNGILQKGCRRAYHIGLRQYGLLTFGMGQYQGFGMLFLQRCNLFHGELLMYMTRSVPQQHITSGYGINIAP